MPTFIHHIATGNPPLAYSQAYSRDRFKDWAPEARTKRLIQMIYNRSGIETRHSIASDSMEDPAALYRSDADGRFISPGTAERNAVYGPAARTLAVDVARRAIADAPGFDAADVTHVIFASCTGFSNPGPDYHMVRDLGLRPNTQRFLLGFMGCYAAFPALRMAEQFCQADPEAVVLVVCLEFCSLHVQVNDRPDSILANSLFADGAAAAVVSARLPQKRKPAYRMSGFESALLPEGEADMAWEIGNEGFNIVLSSYVPQIIGANIHKLLLDVLERRGTSIDRIDEWAVHPGGRAILDKVEESLHLHPAALEHSRNVLRDYGNMSSATILFVLKDMLDAADTDDATVCAIAFGPGLTLETALLERIGCPAAPRVPRLEVEVSASIAELAEPA